LQILMILAR
jgi:hypothetical protein